MTVAMKIALFCNVTRCSSQTFTDILKQSRLISPDHIPQYGTVRTFLFFLRKVVCYLENTRSGLLKTAETRFISSYLP
jgi:hypothetical protein